MRSGVVTFVLFAILPAGIAGNGFYNEWTMKQRNAAMNAQFTKRCTEDARITIRRVIENVDGVFITKPRTPENMGSNNEQFAKGDWYGNSSDLFNEPGLLLEGSWFKFDGRPREKPLPGFKFVEFVNPERLKNSTAAAYVKIVPDPNYVKPHSRQIIRSEANALTARDGVDWDDVSTSEDRQQWIAGGKTRIIDLQTKEVIAERIGYVINPSRGGQVGGGVWMLGIGNVYCPQFENEEYKTLEFLTQVLKSSKEENRGK